MINDDSKLSFNLYNLDGTLNETKSVSLPTPLGTNWHEIAGSLFNFTLRYYLDGVEILKVSDTVLYYNLSSNIGDKISIDLSTSGQGTII